jgi:uncharacterized membrane protein required for colicin V production
MIFSIIILLLVGVITYFYYAQGFFTSLLTAACATTAAVVAVSYHENLANLLFKSRLTDEGAAISLALLFAVTFSVMRLTLDAAVPGNIHLPLLMDRIGAAIFGLIAAIFATGVFAIAIQTLPFGPSIMGQSRFKTSGSRSVQVPNAGSQATDSQASDELVSEQLNDDDRQSLWVPVDQWVLGFVSSLSDGGSLAGDRTLASVHPNYLDELFAQRLGIQAGAEHIAVNSPGHNQVTVPLAYCPPELGEADAEIPQLRDGALKLLKPTLKNDASHVIIVIRAMFTSTAADSDKYVRFSTGSIRLVGNGADYYPLGTLDGSGVLRVNKLDDFLFTSVSGGDSGADLVFYVPRAGILQGGTVTKDSKGKQVSESFGSFISGTFLEVKRMAVIDLADVKLVAPQAPDQTVNVLRKKGIPDPKATVSVAPPADMGDNSPFAFSAMDVTPKIFTPIAVGLIDGDNATVTFPSGTAQVRTKNAFAKLTLNPVTTLADLPKGDNAIDQLFVPPDMKAVQLVGTLPPKATDPWEWAEHLGDFSVTGADGKPYKPSGAVAKAMKSFQPMAVGAYDSDAGVASIAAVPEVRPTDVWLIFLVPNSANLKELDYQGKRLASLNAAVGN